MQITPAIVWWITSLWLLVAGGGFIHNAAAATRALESHTHIRLTAETFLRDHHRKRSGRTEITARAIDRRVQLPKCATPLQAFLPPGGRTDGSATIGVRCGGPKSWRLFVVVDVAIFASVPVLTRDIARGETLTREDLRLDQRNTARGLRHHVKSIAALVGQRARRPLKAGDPVQTHHIARPHWIQKGQRITLVAKTGGINVRMAGIALNDGALGDTVRARNTRSQRVVEGVIIARGVIEVPM
ncbi:MAG: flagellar basal body P-ring formation chaperone FlgA [Pseudomonadota bacterium]